MSVFQNKLRLAYSRERETAERKRFHSAFNTWLTERASDADLDQLVVARSAFAPDKPCSMYRLVKESLPDRALAERLPASLRQLLQAQCSQRACAAARVP